MLTNISYHLYHGSKILIGFAVAAVLMFSLGYHLPTFAEKLPHVLGKQPMATTKPVQDSEGLQQAPIEKAPAIKYEYRPGEVQVGQVPAEQVGANTNKTFWTHLSMLYPSF